MVFDGASFRGFNMYVYDERGMRRGISGPDDRRRDRRHNWHIEGLVGTMNNVGELMFPPRISSILSYFCAPRFAGLCVMEARCEQHERGL